MQPAHRLLALRPFFINLTFSFNWVESDDRAEYQLLVAEYTWLLPQIALQCSRREGKVIRPSDVENKTGGSLVDLR